MKTVNEQTLYELFDSIFSAVTADSDLLKHEIMEEHRLSAEKGRKGRRFLPLKIALASILVLALSVTTYAAAIGGFEELLERISLSFGDVVKPVSIVKEDQDIRLEVLAAQCYNDEAVLYITLQDLTDQGRIDETTQLAGETFGEKSSSYGATELDYDIETGKAAFEVRVRSQDLADSLKVKFNKISTTIYTMESENITVDMEKYLQEVGNPAMKESGGHGADFLKSSQIVKIPGVEDVYLSAVGISDGWFCIQTTTPENGGYDIWPYLKDTDSGNMVKYKMATWSSENGGINEFYFDVDMTRLSSYNIFLEGTRSRIMKGDWSVEVDISNPDQIVSGTGWYENEKFSDGGETKETVSGEITVTLNPLGLTVNAYGDIWEAIQDVELKTTEGKILLKLSVGGPGYTEEQLVSDEPPVWEETICESYYPAETPIDLDTVTEVWVDGNLIWEKEP